MAVQVVQALGRIRDPRAVNTLMVAFKQRDQFDFADQRLAAIARNDARLQAAADALVQIGPAAVVPLIAALNDRVGYGQPAEHVAAAKDTLVRIGRVAVEPLVAAITKENVDVSIEAEVLSRIGDGSAVRPIVAALRRRGRNWDVSEGLSVLQAVLEKTSHTIEEDDLRAVVDLGNRVSGIRSSWMNVAGAHCNSATYRLVQKNDTADCSLIRQLARQELIRRELKA